MNINDILENRDSSRSIRLLRLNILTISLYKLLNIYWTIHTHICTHIMTMHKHSSEMQAKVWKHPPTSQIAQYWGRKIFYFFIFLQSLWHTYGGYWKPLACITSASIQVTGDGGSTGWEFKKGDLCLIYEFREMVTGHFSMKVSAREINVNKSVTAI